ncbi:MAG: hypothetical protein OEW75_01200 [Cyclobacteriaceae bacterium]|nr:hypothetical protein [Cyclobacteriaceae bacterium]
MNIDIFISYISILSPLIGVIVFLKYKQKLTTNSLFKLITGLLLFWFIADFIGLIMAINGVNNHYLINIVGVVEAILIVIIFYKILFKFKTTVMITGVVFIIMFTIYTFVIQSYETFANYGRGMECLVFVFFSFMFFFQLYKYETDIFIEGNPLFLVVIAFFIYFSGAFFSYIMFFLMEGFSENFIFTWSLHNVLNIVKNIILAVAIWKQVVK